MLNQSIVNEVLDEALAKGGDFAELFVENNRKESIVMRNGVIEDSVSGIDYGCGLRIFDGFNCVYAYTNDTSKESLIKLAKDAGAVIKNKKNTGDTREIIINRVYEGKEINNIHKVEIQPFDIIKKEKAEMLRIAHNASKEYDKSVTQTINGFMSGAQNILVVNSDGLWAEDTRVRGRMTAQAVASSETEKQVGYLGPGSLSGFEYFKNLDIKALGREAARIAVTMLKAELCPSGLMPVIIDNGFGGVIFHEACGHSLEATSVAKGGSVFCGKLGEQIAAPRVTAVDDGTIPNAWGSCNIDDEGNITQKNILIENGVLKSYLVDRLNGRKMKMRPTGSGRRESYKYAPTSRMTNTFIANGSSSPEDIIANTEYGLYAKKMGGGSVEPATGEFNFAVLEGYIVRNGKIAEPVRGATLIGKGSEVLMNIDMVGNNLARSQGMCGSSSGSVPTDVGQPMIRVKEITVGGRK
ncbi:MAG: TldD/PmbA family protein [Oscillospiraceae bacterium]|nr:TldD/PmbA family protein [Oscillospiraceae bacterium]